MPSVLTRTHLVTAASYVTLKIDAPRVESERRVDVLGLLGWHRCFRLLVDQRTCSFAFERTRHDGPAQRSERSSKTEFESLIARVRINWTRSRLVIVIFRSQPRRGGE